MVIDRVAGVLITELCTLNPKTAILKSRRNHLNVS